MSLPTPSESTFKLTQYLTFFLPGAGNCLDETKYKATCKQACQIAAEILRVGGTALEACESAIMVLENSSETNAGFGSNLSWDKKIECDASIMDGTTLNYGACTNVSRVLNPITLAKKLCDKQSRLLQFGRIPPVLLSGEGAESYAKEIGLDLVEPSSLISEKALRSYHYWKSKFSNFEAVNNVILSPLDTVGAVCCDGDGNIASGCSSGGIILKITGRVGQAASYGAGCWAVTNPNKSAATCTTGNGEYLVKTLLAKEIVDSLILSDCSITSLHKTFKEKFIQSPYIPESDEVYGGALSVVFDAKSGIGEVLWSHTTKSMCLGYMTTKQKKPKFVLSTLPLNATPGKNIQATGISFRLP